MKLITSLTSRNILVLGTDFSESSLHASKKLVGGSVKTSKSQFCKQRASDTKQVDIRQMSCLEKALKTFLILT